MKTVLAHGVFDGLHIGHIRHLEAAKALGDYLVVSVTADEYVNKGPGRPVFALKDRLDALRALRFVDAAVESQGPNAVPMIKALKPDIFAKGMDYENRGIIPEEVDACDQVGAGVAYIGEKLGSSSTLYRNEDPFLEHCRKRWSPEDFRAAVEGFASLKVRVVGDAIRDQYTEVEPQGLTSKSRTLTVRQVQGTRTMRGGALAVHDHVSALGACSSIVVGRTVTKHRYIAGGHKLFGVDTVALLGAPLDDLLTREPLHNEWDTWIVADFGHGTMTEAIREAVQNDGRFLALNCQTNSANFGFNVITDRYQRADMFSVDHTELALAIRQPDPSPLALFSMRGSLQASVGFATFGGNKTYCSGTFDDYECPALEPNPIDTMGAGDAFFAAASLAAARRYDPDLCLLIGQLAGALHTRIIGNSEPITKAALIKAGMSLLAR